MRRYKDFKLKYREQDPREVFCDFSFVTQPGASWEYPYERLAIMAQQEDWGFTHEEFRGHYPQQTYPILMNYLNYTFLRLQDLDLVTYTDDGTKACFNTGLLTNEEQDIYVTFYRNKKAELYNKPDWTLFGFANSYDVRRSGNFPVLPEAAWYYDDPAELFYDCRVRAIEADYDHILNEDTDRLPEVLRSNRFLALNQLKAQVDGLQERARRNYKLAIPHWYDNRVQLLLPLSLVRPGKADIALVVEKDVKAQVYMARTILSLDMAYMDARLIARPDREWLDP